jgi:hypothetical protein
MTTDPGYPPLLAQGQTWEEMTVGSVFRTAARNIKHEDIPNGPVARVAAEVARPPAPAAPALLLGPLLAFHPRPGAHPGHGCLPPPAARARYGGNLARSSGRGSQPRMLITLGRFIG